MEQDFDTITSEDGFSEDGEEAEAREALTCFQPSEVVLPIVRRQLFSFDGRASGTTETIVVANGTDAPWWVSGAVLVVLHAKNAWLTGVGGNTTGRLNVDVVNMRVADEEPGLIISDEARFTTSTSIVASTNAPLTTINSLVTPFGPQLYVRLRFLQGVTAAAAAQTATLSVYLIGRGA